VSAVTASETNAVTGELVSLDGEQYFRIANSHRMPDFFMSLVGASDHWMFVSSCGALTAGRRDPDQALFPYASDDQISAARATTGSTTLIRTPSEDRDGRPRVWSPFAPDADGPDLRRNLYKTPLGNKLVFEEIDESLQLVFRYRWTFSRRFGFVRSCRLENTAREPRSLDLLDGLRNVLPWGVGSEFYLRFSNLGDAYKRSELLPDSNLGLFYLSSIPTDRAEPSEGLKATIVWQTGLTPNATLLSVNALRAFRRGDALTTETDVRGKAGAYLASQSTTLPPGEAIEWHVVAELAQDHAAIVRLDDRLRCASDVAREIADDVHASERELLRIVSSADGVQCGANRRRSNRHQSNTIFNVMRGGVPLEGYRVHADDFARSVGDFNREAYDRNRAFLDGLPSVQDAADLQRDIAALQDRDLTRLGMEYLPLAFSRRHGDPTRPWNRFSIDLESDDGSTNLSYEGNWRDIFQNWEALLVSFPAFSTAMVARFVNATTADGYNPYRVTKDGFEWEEPTPQDPWANIGYWGDHQIIYLLKLLEWARSFSPQGLDELLNSPAFVHADIPYRIKDYEAIKRNPRDTIEFDDVSADAISRRVATIGADGKLLRNRRDEIHYVTLVEKILTLSLAKLANFVPDGGIWLNTQRPEWNDANNALVGNGLSMVTACYLHRWFKFLLQWIGAEESESYRVSREVAVFFDSLDAILRRHAEALSTRVDAKTRLQIVDALSGAGSDYRSGLYASGLDGQCADLSRQRCLDFFAIARACLETTIRNSKGPGGLFHAYNLLDWTSDGLEIEPLYEMLEGQVAALSSGLLTPVEAVQLLDALRDSALYREDQQSYLLYPDRQLPRFLEKNQLSREPIEQSPLLQKLLADGDERIVIRDIRGGIHFNGAFRNSTDLQAALESLGPQYESAVRDHGPELVRLFDDVFGHRQFTGRSGTFFAYEGLGSIYWHMVSKLHLTVSENIFWALDAGTPPDVVDALAAHLREVQHGIGAEKTPAEYGAFPSDPYSHSPENAGVKQPGMTGQVKEDILARFAEIGAHVEDGCLGFRLDLFDRDELASEPGELAFFDLDGEFRTLPVARGEFGFTLFQVPITYRAGDEDTVRVEFASGEQRTIDGTRLDHATSRQLFSRSGDIEAIECRFKALRC